MDNETKSLSPSNYWRQLDIYNPDKHLNPPITIVGCGGIGSITILALSKLGIKTVCFYDDDCIEEHNIPNQFFFSEDIGKEKTLGVVNTISKFSPNKHINMFPTCEKVELPLVLRIPEGILISAVDSMESRKNVWESCKLGNYDLFIDGRIGGQIIQVFSVIPADIIECKRYEQFLMDDKETVEPICTQAGIIDISLMVAQVITRAIRRFLVEHVYEFMVTYDNENQLFYYYREEKYVCNTINT